jgi:hypothetical protein
MRIKIEYIGSVSLLPNSENFSPEVFRDPSELEVDFESNFEEAFLIGEGEIEKKLLAKDGVLHLYRLGERVTPRGIDAVFGVNNLILSLEEMRNFLIKGAVNDGHGTIFFIRDKKGVVQEVVPGYDCHIGNDYIEMWPVENNQIILAGNYIVLPFRVED